jgi:thymidylate kinase
MGLMIMLEGNECTFKSTIGKILADKLNIPLEQGSSFEIAKKTRKDLFEYYTSRACRPGDIIYDRFMYSNRTYAQLYPGVSLLSLDQVEYIENLIRENHTPLVVYCYGENRDLISRLSARGDKDVKVREIPIITRKFDQVILTECMLPLMVFNSSVQTSEEGVEYILKRIRRNQVGKPEAD